MLQERDTFSADVAMGGLWNKSDIKLLICYILSSVDDPLSREDIMESLQEKKLANYFDISEAFEEQLKLGNIAEVQEGLYTVTENGRKISDTLYTVLPLSVKDKAMESAVRLMGYARSRRENKVEITDMEVGVQVTCHISDGKRDLMTISTLVADRAQAEMVRDTFHSNPQRVYQVLLCALTGDRSLLESFFGEELEELKKKEE